MCVLNSKTLDGGNRPLKKQPERKSGKVCVKINQTETLREDYQSEFHAPLHKQIITIQKFNTPISTI